MILFEFEGKEILKKYGINVPNSQLIDSADQEITIQPPLVLKAQVLSGKRADVGGIVLVKEINDLRFKIKELLGKTINNEIVEKVLVEEMVEFEGGEYYVSIS